MKIEPLKLTIRDLVEGYSDDGDGGVTGYGGRLDIRPPYQREFVYKGKQREAVINTVRRGFPLNSMYWVIRDDGGFEVIDGQQRTISICQYVNGDFSIGEMMFGNLQDDEQAAILDYPLWVYTCSGSGRERLDWFEIINTAGERLTKQELRNAVYHGPWVSNAKRYFSRPGCAAYKIASKYLSGDLIRQDYLETAIGWINNGDIENYMSKHQHNKSAVALWNHFQSVIAWVEATFPNYRRQMKGLKWGELYATHHKRDLDPAALESEIKRLLMDDEVQKKSGVWAYVLDGDERHLNLRSFTEAMRIETYERQNGICAETGEHYPIEEMEADHITPWSKGGKTIVENCQMLHKDCNRRKSNK